MLNYSLVAIQCNSDNFSLCNSITAILIKKKSKMNVYHHCRRFNLWTVGIKKKKRTVLINTDDFLRMLSNDIGLLAHMKTIGPVI